MSRMKHTVRRARGAVYRQRALAFCWRLS